MSFLPDWWSQGTNAYTPENKFGQAGMFDKPMAGQTGDFGGYLPKLIDMLRNRGEMNPSATPDMTNKAENAPQMDNMPSFTPYQTTPIGPDMNKVQRAYGMSPNWQIMPNWNRTYGGY
jgi:hypothetical protein